GGPAEPGMTGGNIMMTWKWLDLALGLVAAFGIPDPTYTASPAAPVRLGWPGLLLQSPRALWLFATRALVTSMVFSGFLQRLCLRLGQILSPGGGSTEEVIDCCRSDAEIHHDSRSPRRAGVLANQFTRIRPGADPGQARRAHV